MGMETLEVPLHPSGRGLLKTRTLQVALYAIFATCLVGWCSGWLGGPTFGPQTGDGNFAAYEKSLRQVEHVLDSYSDTSQSWWALRRRPPGGAVLPFSTFSCLGDENAAGIIYARPFRFHVYSNMPDELYNNTLVKADKYWARDHRCVS